MNDLIRKLCRYFFTGGIAAIIDIGIFSLLVRSHLAVMPAAAVSFCVANVFNFLLTSRFVFKQQSSSRRYLLFFLGALIGLTVNVGVTTIGTIIVALPAILAKLLGIGVAFLINFFINLKLVFRNKHHRPI